MNPITSFTGQYRFLSNFYKPAFVLYQGLTYLTSEHAFQAAKSWDPKYRAKIAKLPYPGQAKHAGRLIKLRPDWEKIKYGIMEEILWAKFDSRVLVPKLIATYPSILIEGNDWKDYEWGACWISIDHPLMFDEEEEDEDMKVWVSTKDGKVLYGRNQLGISLMKIRAELIKSSK